ncbi:MAG: hypothetical protein Kow0074_08090 [Candidatus Zixiibacteriota bacterium]
MRRISAWLSTGLIGLILLSGQDARAAVNAGVLFLRIAPGARSAAMGEAFVGVANDATATHWNPAGLGIYPLNDDWQDYSLPDMGTIIDAAVVRNDLPYSDYRARDLWILTDRGMYILEHGSSGQWSATSQAGAEGHRIEDADASNVRVTNLIEISTVGVGSIAAAVRRYAPYLSEDQAEEIARHAAGVHMGIDLAELEPLLTRVESAMPDQYKDRTLVQNALTEFRRAFREARIIEERVPDVRAALAAIPESGTASTDQLDRVRFTLQRAVGNAIPDRIPIRSEDLFPATIRAMNSDGQRLYVGTANNLLVLYNNRWDQVPAPTEDGWAAEGINCIDVAANNRIWVGTDKGLLLRSSGTWKRYTTAEGLPSNRILHAALPSQRDGWVNTDAGLARFHGEFFSAFAELTANVGDSLNEMLSRFLDTRDDVVLEEAAARVRKANMMDPDFEPEAGSVVQVPYMVGFTNQITSLEVDSYGRLWVGTDRGTLRFTRNAWTRYGYREITATESTTANAVAEELLGNRATPERTSNLARLIIAYNGLNASGDIAAGRTVYVYRNPAASHVYDIESNGERVMIASAAGLLEVKSGDWSRYYHAGLERDVVHAITPSERDMWFVSDDRAVIFKKSRSEVTFMYSPWLPDFNLDLYYAFFSGATHVEGWGTLGLAVTFFSYGEIIRTDEFGRLGNSFHSFDGAFSLSYATRLSPTLSGGLTGKVIYSRLADQGAGAEIGSGSATAFAIDAGLLYQTPWRPLTLGAAISNVGPDISYIDAQQSDPLPRNLAIGFGYKLIEAPAFQWLLVGDLNRELVSLTDSDNEFSQNIYNVGTEISYLSTLAVRGGYVYDKDGDIKVFTLGLGLAYQNVQIDVAYIPSTGDSPLSNTPRYSLSARF